MIIKFSFIETIYTYKYYNFFDFFEAMGGLGNSIGFVMGEIGVIFIWLFFLDMIRVIYS